MLARELKGERINKTRHRNALLPILKNRSEGSIEFKHQNISAVLARLGQPFISGYKPRFNYQQTLYDKVLEFLNSSSNWDNLFAEFSDQEIKKANKKIDFEKLKVEPPEPSRTDENQVNEPGIAYRPNYLEREQANMEMGRAGEFMAVEYERWSLRKRGKDKLADAVEWVSETQGDGFGYDIVSRNLDGTDKYIEVKTTRLSKYAPFYFTHNELSVSRKQANRYYVYRFFNFERRTNFFALRGSFDSICTFHPTAYKGII